MTANGMSHVMVCGGSVAEWAAMSPDDWRRRIALVATAARNDGAAWVTLVPYAGVDADGAQRIIDSAIRQISQLRGRLGAFVKYTLDATVRSQSVALENANAAESAIRDTDFAGETSKLTRSQILSQATSTVLAQANSQPQSVLSLLQS